MRLPVVEEQVHVEKRLKDPGYVKVRKTVDTEQVMSRSSADAKSSRSVGSKGGGWASVDNIAGAHSPFEHDMIRVPVLGEPPSSRRTSSSRARSLSNDPR